MFKLLGRMFGSERAMDTAVNGVVSGLDKLFYTDEERAEDGRAERSEARSMVIGWMDKTQGQNLARRFLAMVITSVWLGQYLFVMGMSTAVIWVDNDDIVTRMEASSTLIGGYADGMTGAMMLILGFYFAAPHLGTIISGAMSRFGRSNEVSARSAGD